MMIKILNVHHLFLFDLESKLYRFGSYIITNRHVQCIIFVHM